MPHACLDLKLGVLGSGTTVPKIIKLNYLKNILFIHLTTNLVLVNLSQSYIKKC